MRKEQDVVALHVADLVQLDYSNPELRAYMADVFLFWCRIGVDGFRCDAGYMIPAETWEYIVARVREEYPDTIFMLEGLGGKLEVTDRLLAESNLDWAYSEIFQTYDRGQFEWYLPNAFARSEKYGTLVHFAETHDNDRLAKGGETYARLRVQLAALLSAQGAWGIANGVEWYCTEKIDVHGKNDLFWGAERNMVDLIAKLNALLDTNPSFSGNSRLEVVTRGDGNTLAVLRHADASRRVPPVLVLANLDCANGCTVDWDRGQFACGDVVDLLTGERLSAAGPLSLGPGEVRCLQPAVIAAADCAEDRLVGVRDGIELALEDAVRRAGDIHWHWRFPRDVRRDVVVPEGQWVEVSAPTQFRMRLIDPETGKTVRVYRSSGCKVVFDAPHYHGDGTRCRTLELHLTVYADGKATRTRSRFLIPPTARRAKAKLTFSGEEVRRHPDYRTVLSNGAGAAAQVRLGWGVVRSQYDALLAANPNPAVPSDRLTLWTRTRCWLQREGYARELDAKCVTRFVADPAGKSARWDFAVPCGMGKETAFAFELSLVPGENAARLKVTRAVAAANDVLGVLPDGRAVGTAEASDDRLGRVGAAVLDDIRGLQKIFPFQPANFVDLQKICPEWGIQEKSVKKLTAIILGKRISKTQQLSNWEAPQLSDAQKIYAATDAWICREMYNKLLDSEKVPEDSTENTEQCK